MGETITAECSAGRGEPTFWTVSGKIIPKGPCVDCTSWSKLYNDGHTMITLTPYVYADFTAYECKRVTEAGVRKISELVLKEKTKNGMLYARSNLAAMAFAHTNVKIQRAWERSSIPIKTNGLIVLV